MNELASPGRASFAVAFALGVAACVSPPRRDGARIAAARAPSRDRVVYVGTYTAPGIPPGGSQPSKARGIYVFRMRGEDGHLTPLETVPTDNPSYLALDPTRTHLYCVNEDGAVDGAPAGRVSAFAIDPSSGLLTLLDSRPTGGTFPAYVGVHPSGRYLLAANYGEGGYPVYRVLEDGSIGPETDDARAAGAPDGSHAHQILTDPDARHVFGVDLGADEISIWDLDSVTGRLTPSAPPVVALPRGSGPRHMAFLPDGRFAYVLGERASSIWALRHDRARGALVRLEAVSTLPASFTGPNAAAELRVHPSGRFVYATNRGHDSVAMFAVDPGTGSLRALGWEPTRGAWPRGMNLDPSGAFLYVANQRSDTIVVFRVDPSTGRLTPTGEATPTPTPVDIEFGPLLN